MTSIQVSNLRKAYPGGVNALDGIDLTVESGELLVLLGPSGCGKSTLLRCLAGLEQQTSGTITIDGTTVADADSGLFQPAFKRDIGMVFQSFTLWPHMTVQQNVMYPLVSRRSDKAGRRQRVQQMLELVQCAHLKDRYPGQLSGGQQQRIALARALASNPQVLLLDEPLSALDALLRTDLKEQLRLLHRDLGYTGVYVTHDQSEALALGSRVAVMREGRLEQVATPGELYTYPATEYVAGFLGIRNRVEVAGGGLVWTAAGQRLDGALDRGVERPSDSYTLYVRPTDLTITRTTQPKSDQSRISMGTGRIRDVLYQGHENEYLIEWGPHLLVAICAPDPSLVTGSSVEITFQAPRALLYADGVLQPAGAARATGSSARIDLAAAPSMAGEGSVRK